MLSSEYITPIILCILVITLRNRHKDGKIGLINKVLYNEYEVTKTLPYEINSLLPDYGHSDTYCYLVQKRAWQQYNNGPMKPRTN